MVILDLSDVECITAKEIMECISSSVNAFEHSAGFIPDTVLVGPALFHKLYVNDCMELSSENRAYIREVRVVPDFGHKGIIMACASHQCFDRAMSNGWLKRDIVAYDILPVGEFKYYCNFSSKDYDVGRTVGIQFLHRKI